MSERGQDEYENEDDQLTPEQRQMRENLERHKKELNELKKEISKLKKQFKKLPEDKRQDILDDLLMDQESKANDYRYLNKVFDNINLNTLDKRKLNENTKYIQQLNLFNIKTNLVNGKASRDSQLKIANMESVIRRSINNTEQAQSARVAIQQAKQSELMQILEKNEDREETINEIRKKELLYRIKNNLNEMSKSNSVKVIRQDKKDPEPILEKDEYGWPRKTEQRKSIMFGSLVASQRGVLSQLKKKQIKNKNSMRQFSKQQQGSIFNKIPSIMKTDTDSLLSGGALSKKDSLHSSLLESEITIDKDNIPYNEHHHIHIIDPLSENLETLEIPPIQNKAFSQLPRYSNQLDKQALLNLQQQQTAMDGLYSTTNKYQFMKQPPSLMMKKFFKGYSTTRSTSQLPRNEMTEYNHEQNRQLNTIQDAQATGKSEKIIYLKQQIAQTAIPSMYLQRKDKLHFSDLAPSILFSKQDHKKYLQNALKYNKGTLAKINAEFSSRNQEIQANCENTNNTFYDSQVEKKRMFKNQSVGMLRKSNNLIPAPISKRLVSPPINDNIQLPTPGGSNNGMKLRKQTDVIIQMKYRSRSDLKGQQNTQEFIQN
ncbi:UNKNOWN [Stylonychia lemnae]|uniref:Uncharacterized protein n=1 Tax=Stylonychia lemnae TaxID=5949 RepID=A0A078B193_STYLE|nr:UNKNOWN [Stylonychia lemnae]|eukprot:CDW87127.1 UNKNOWN [Stylonychia lemnae]